MTNKEAVKILKDNSTYWGEHDADKFCEAYDMAIKALGQEPKTGWNNHQIACMLADLFGDACACNYNGIDEWLSELCDFKDACCPNPVGVACWEQFLKYSQSRYTECGYEVRDKNALQKPKIGHWNTYKITQSGINEEWLECSECMWSNALVIPRNYCPNCGCRMVEPQESEVQDADSN